MKTTLGKATFFIGIAYIISNLHDFIVAIYAGIRYGYFDVPGLKYSLTSGEIFFFYFKMIGIPLVVLAISIVYFIFYNKNNCKVKELTIAALIIHSLRFVYSFFYPLDSVGYNISAGIRSFVLFLVLIGAFVMSLIPSVPRKVTLIVLAADVVWLSVTRIISSVEAVQVLFRPGISAAAPIPYYLFIAIIRPLVIEAWMIAFYGWMLFPDMFVKD